MAWRATKELWDVRWRRGGFVFDLGELSLKLWGEDLGKSAGLLIDSNIDTTIVCDKQRFVSVTLAVHALL